MKALAMAAALAALTACGESGRTAGEQQTPGVTQANGSDLGQVYPSQAGRTAAVTPGAEGGRSSAATGATEQGLEDLPAGEAGPDSQQRPRR